MTLSLHDRVSAIALLVIDVDGVLTAGGIEYGSGGLEIKTFHVRDGSGLKLWHRAGKQSAVITGRTSEVVDIRANELGIATVVQGASDKLPAFLHLLEKNKVSPGQVAYVGDDLPDLPPMLRAGLAVAVADAASEVRACAHFVTRAAGGCGAVREVIELVLRGQGRWSELVRELLKPEG